jgi:hypothetical protein
VRPLPEPDAALLAAYLATTWTVRLPAGPVPVRVGAPAPDPALRPSGIVTACNPASRRRDTARNRHANVLLLRRLDAMGLAWLPALAHGTGAEAHLWDEPGFALPGAPREAVVALGRRFGQNAVVWMDAAGRVSLAATRDGFCGCRVGQEVPGTAPHETADPAGSGH